MKIKFPIDLGSRIVAILPSSPWPEGRVGPKEEQDWHRCFREALRLQSETIDLENGEIGKYRGSLIIVPSAFRWQGKSEIRFYQEEADELGLSESHFLPLPVGFETVGQILVANTYAVNHGSKLILVCRQTQVRRVEYICRQAKIVAGVVGVGGYSRPSEVRTDRILTFLFPLIDLLGLRPWLLQRVIDRRKQGKL